MLKEGIGIYFGRILGGAMLYIGFVLIILIVVFFAEIIGRIKKRIDKKQNQKIDDAYKEGE